MTTYRHICTHTLRITTVTEGYINQRISSHACYIFPAIPSSNFSFYGVQIMKFLFERNFETSSPSYFQMLPSAPSSYTPKSVFVPALCQTKFHTHTKRVWEGGILECHLCVRVRAFVSLSLVCRNRKKLCCPYK